MAHFSQFMLAIVLEKKRNQRGNDCIESDTNQYSLFNKRNQFPPIVLGELAFRFFLGFCNSADSLL